MTFLSCIVDKQHLFLWHVIWIYSNRLLSLTLFVFYVFKFKYFDILVSIYLFIVNQIFISYGFCLSGYQHMVMSILSKSNNNPSNVRPFLFRPMYCFIHAISFVCYAFLEDSWKKLFTVRRKTFFSSLMLLKKLWTMLR